MNHEKEPKKSSITLSIRDDIMKQLRHDAAAENISVNQKVNNVLLRWLYLYRAIGVAGAMVISSESWKLVTSKMDDQSLEEIMDYESRIAGAILAQNDIPLTLENLIEHIFSKTGLFSGAFSHFHTATKDSGDLVLSFEHPFGIRWSRLLGGSICKFIGAQWKYDAELTATARNITIMIDFGAAPNSSKNHK